MERLDALAAEVQAELLRDADPPPTVPAEMPAAVGESEATGSDADVHADSEADSPEGMPGSANDGGVKMAGSDAGAGADMETIARSSSQVGASTSAVHTAVHTSYTPSTGGCGWGPELIQKMGAMRVLVAVNAVLFDRHGYRPCNRYGVARDSQMSSVMERGVGSSAALSILYMEVCDRVGLPMAARGLEEGR